MVAKGDLGGACGWTERKEQRPFINNGEMIRHLVN